MLSVAESAICDCVGALGECGRCVVGFGHTGDCMKVLAIATDSDEMYVFEGHAHDRWYVCVCVGLQCGVSDMCLICECMY